MGILADIFVATQDDALCYEDLLMSGKEVPEDRFERAEHKGFTGLEFGTLWAIALGETWDVHRHLLKNLTHGDEGETWLESFPAGLVAVLAAIEDGDTERLCGLWAATDELLCDGSDLAPVLDDLRRLARRAQAEGKGLYLWGSL